MAETATLTLTFFFSERTVSHDSDEFVIRTTHAVKYLLFVILIAHRLLRLLHRKSNFGNNKSMHMTSYMPLKLP